MKEIWKPIRGYENLYEVSNLGRVKALERYVQNNGGAQKRHEMILKQSGKFHFGVTLCKDGKTKRKTVHRLVAEAFIPNPENKPVVDHIDTNPKNNRVDNLRWVTIQENAMNPLTRINNSNSKKGHPCYNSKPMSEETKEKIRQARIGRKASEATKAKLRASHLGKSATDETRKKLSQVKKGHPVSAETRTKIAEKVKGVHKGMRWKVIDGKRVWY